MIIIGIPLNTNGTWEEKHLTSAFEHIFQKHRHRFQEAMDASSSPP